MGQTWVKHFKTFFDLLYFHSFFVNCIIEFTNYIPSPQDFINLTDSDAFHRIQFSFSTLFLMTLNWIKYFTIKVADNNVLEVVYKLLEVYRQSNKSLLSTEQQIEVLKRSAQ